MKRLVIINGPPASGKSTVLGELKKSLGWKTVTKDEIKEGLMPNWTIYKHGVELPEDAVGIYTAWRNDFAAKAMATLNLFENYTRS